MPRHCRKQVVAHLVRSCLRADVPLETTSICPSPEVGSASAVPTVGNFDKAAPLKREDLTACINLKDQVAEQPFTCPASQVRRTYCAMYAVRTFVIFLSSFRSCRVGRCASFLQICMKQLYKRAIMFKIMSNFQLSTFHKAKVSTQFPFECILRSQWSSDREFAPSLAIISSQFYDRSIALLPNLRGHQMRFSRCSTHKSA